MQEILNTVIKYTYPMLVISDYTYRSNSQAASKSIFNC